MKRKAWRVAKSKRSVRITFLHMWLGLIIAIKILQESGLNGYMMERKRIKRDFKA